MRIDVQMSLLKTIQEVQKYCADGIKDVHSMVALMATSTTTTFSARL